MSSSAGLRISAFVAPAEAAAVEDAARRLGEALPLTVEFASSLDDLGAGAADALTIVSLLPEVEAALQDWPAAETRLMRRYGALAALGAERLFLCTVFRHAPAELDDDARIALRLAIRRLDLLAVNVSQATGVNVIDLDRALADIGARKLRTDYRLGGALAAEAAGEAIATALLAAGIEDLVAP